MLYGVISDVHSNLEALEAVLAELDRLGAARILFVGDVVGYGADPNACVEIVHARAELCIRGNHDRMVAAGEAIWSYPYAGSDVRDADLRNREALSPVNTRRLRSLPSGPLEADGGILICHGSPSDEDEYLVSWTAMGAARELVLREYPRSSTCFFGHTHVALVVEDGRRAVEGGAALKLEEGALYLINPGAVGQPRDGDARASFGVLDAERRVYRNHRVSYDIAKAQRKIISSGLPRRFADRLRHGR